MARFASPLLAQCLVAASTLACALAAQFSCGPYLLTYRVVDLWGTPGNGVRCVKFSEGATWNSLPAFAWYGEGSWGTWWSTTYRHVGHAFYVSKYVMKGTSTDIYGNGESSYTNYQGSLVIRVMGDRSMIWVDGPISEVWIQVDSVDAYNGMAPPTTCGPNLIEYNVASTKKGVKGSGLRCVLKGTPNVTTWFGNGDWNGALYAHVGTRGGYGYGASGICDQSVADNCNYWVYGQIGLNTTSSTSLNAYWFWHEKWSQ